MIKDNKDEQNKLLDEYGLISAEQVASMFNMNSVRGLDYYVKSEILPKPIRIGHASYFNKDSLKAYLQMRKQSNAKNPG